MSDSIFQLKRLERVHAVNRELRLLCPAKDRSTILETARAVVARLDADGDEVDFGGFASWLVDSPEVQEIDLSELPLRGLLCVFSAGRGTESVVTSPVTSPTTTVAAGTATQCRTDGVWENGAGKNGARQVEERASSVPRKCAASSKRVVSFAALRRARTTLEDFSQFYMPLHGLPQNAFFRWLPQLVFIEVRVQPNNFQGKSIAN